MTPTTHTAPPMRSALEARGMKPITELARQRPHGDRLRYMAGCRCPACRGANTAYERMRARARKAGLGNPIVPADEARAHLKALSADAGGRATVAQATDISSGIVQMIAAGTREKIRLATAREAAQAEAERTAPVPAGATRQRLEWLREELGHPKRVARAIGITEDELHQVCAARSFKTKDGATVPRAFADLVEAAYRRLQA